jgi:hypothetical protein
LHSANIPQYDTKIVLGDFNAVVGKEVFYKPPIEIHSHHEEFSETGGALSTLPQQET